MSFKIFRNLKMEDPPQQASAGATGASDRMDEPHFQLYSMMRERKAIQDLYIYVNVRHAVRTSYFLMSPSVRFIHLIIEDETPGPWTVEFVDKRGKRLRSLQTADTGKLVIPVSDFKSEDCFLRLTNGRILCITIDKWPDFLPPFMARSRK